MRFFKSYHFFLLNFLSIDSLDKNSQKNRNQILFMFHLRLMRREYNLKFINIFILLENLCGRKVFIRRVSLFFSRLFKSKFLEYVSCTSVPEINFICILNYFNLYFIDFYKKFIKSTSNFTFNATQCRLSLLSLNKIFNFNKRFSKKDKSNILFLSTGMSNHLYTKVLCSFYLNIQRKERILMKYSFIKNRNILHLIITKEIWRLQYKYIFINCNMPFYIRQEAFFNLNELQYNSSLVRLRKRCFYTNKGYFVLKFFNLARFILKLWLYHNKLPGVRKGSW